MFSDKLLGGLLVLSSVCIFCYYSTWVLVLPLLDAGHFLQPYFPPQVYAIAIPATALAVAVALVCTFVGIVMIKEARSRVGKKKEA